MNTDQYIKEVLKNLYASKKIKKRIKEDLEERISAAMEEDAFYNPVSDLGKPEELANEFMDNLDNPDSPWVNVMSPTYSSYEYKSERTIFGLPLIHVNFGNGRQTVTAKGFIAVGDIAIGVISVGGVSAGLISLGGVSLGALAIGGVAIGGFAIGGVAIGIGAIGGVAIALYKTLLIWGVL